METKFYNATEEEVEFIALAGMDAALKVIKDNCDDEDQEFSDSIHSYIKAFSVATKAIKGAEIEVMAKNEGCTYVSHGVSVSHVVCSAFIAMTRGTDSRHVNPRSMAGYQMEAFIKAVKAIESMQEVIWAINGELDDHDGPVIDSTLDQINSQKKTAN